MTWTVRTWDTADLKSPTLALLPNRACRHPAAPPAGNSEKTNYRTCPSGKWHLGKIRKPVDFDRYRGILGGVAGCYKPMPDHSFEENGKLFKPEGLPNGFCMTDDITKTSLVCIANAAREKAPSSSA